ncbi:unnamed protein product [Durusdinium trenchii]|uniref:Uncharacterized protein n=2 Tax=Durusdinium trenchii TaxID=1381693 RepID=A0ABP0IS51_9DINO
MKRGSAFRAGAILLSLGLIGLISQRDALHGFHENENDQVVDAASPYGVVDTTGFISQRDAVDAKVRVEGLENVSDTREPLEVTSSPPRKRLGGVEAMQNFFHELCDLTTRLGLNRSGLRHASLELRARLFAALGDVLSAEPKPLKVPRRRKPLQPNCGHPSLLNLLTGRRRPSGPRMLVDLPTGMGGGPELEYLELRMLELQGIADLMVVAESGFTFRGDAKPRLFQRNRQRFQAFENTTLYLDMERCSNYLKAINETRAQHGQKQVFWAIETRQRQCLWSLLELDQPHLPDETLIIFTDMDEIPNGELMLAMKYCEWKNMQSKFQFSQRALSFNLRQVATAPRQCFPKHSWRQGSLITFKWARDMLKRNQSIPLRLPAKLGPAPVIQGGALHMGYFGSAAALMFKGLQHGEGGNLMLPTSFDICQATKQDILQLLGTYRDDPIRIVTRHRWRNRWRTADQARAWEQKSNPLPKARPSLKSLQNCGVPWALQENPERYAAFWGLPE